MHSGIHCSCKQEVDGKETADPALFWWLVGWFNTLLFSRTDWFLTRTRLSNFVPRTVAWHGYTRNNVASIPMPYKKDKL
jgi:hypothetical protein